MIESISQIDISSPNAISELDSLLRSRSDWKGLSVSSIYKLFGSRSKNSSVMIGLWAFDFLKAPVFIGDSLIGYYENKLDGNEQAAVVSGLLDIIKSCRIELDEDEDAIDFHYSSVGKLYRLKGDDAEGILVDTLTESPSIQLIEALGVLVGTEYQGRLKVETVGILKRFSNSSSDNISLAAERVLTEDVARVNKYCKFLDDDLVL